VAGRVLAARTRLALMSAVSVASAAAASATASRVSVVPVFHTRRAPTSAAGTVSAATPLVSAHVDPCTRHLIVVYPATALWTALAMVLVSITNANA